MNLAENVALALAGALADLVPKSLDADSMDALAEIANMIAGAAKKRLPADQITITVPSLLRTEDVAYPTGLPILALPFDAPAGRFMLEIAMQPNPAASALRPGTAKERSEAT
jgi:CheY-specific phosphatase CheX